VSARALAVGFALLALACTPGPADDDAGLPPVDGGAAEVDAGPDAGGSTDDAGIDDAGDTDAGPADAGATDAGVADAGPPADCPRIRVVDTGGQPLNVRPDPSTTMAVVGQLAPGQLAEVLEVDDDGEDVGGVTTWYRVETTTITGWVSGRYAACTTDEPIAPPDGYLLPLACGTTVTVTQGNASAFSHNGTAEYAFDFSLTANTPLLAMADGTVELVKGDIAPGHPCYSGGDSSCANDVNYVVLRHGDDSATLYLHLNETMLAAGETVARGQPIGLSGGTGWSTGPHAHVQRQQLCGSWWCQSLPLAFGDVDGDGVPLVDEMVTSQNGCGE
jgi:murein DD-endopeptidase MepM/ murein hydrolase activator NlpD